MPRPAAQHARGFPCSHWPRFPSIRPTSPTICRGHDAGDAVLKAAAQALAAAAREGDTVARLGGEEFVLLLPAAADTRETNPRRR